MRCDWFGRHSVIRFLSETPMPRPACYLMSCACLAAALMMPVVTANAAETNPTAADRVREQVLRMTEFFDTMLPGVLGEHNMTIHVTPKFSDLRDNEFMRLPF